MMPKSGNINEIGIQMRDKKGSYGGHLNVVSGLDLDSVICIYKNNIPNRKYQKSINTYKLD